MFEFFAVAGRVNKHPLSLLWEASLSRRVTALVAASHGRPEGDYGVPSPLLLVTQPRGCEVMNSHERPENGESGQSPEEHATSTVMSVGSGAVFEGVINATAGGATDEFAKEQAYLSFAYRCLDAMRHSARQITNNVISEAGGTHQARFERDVLGERSADRLARLELGSESLVFGRIDRTDGEQFHLGRVSVLDTDQNPVVVDWRAPVAEPFYRATGRQPLGLTRRRHLTTQGEKLVSLDDEVFNVDLLENDDSSLVGTGALLAALGRARGSHMRDIVATIQVEQDEIIRSDMHGVLVVQGGPGTGKTAVALHRASYLLYAHRFPLERQGVLVVGPNRTFMRYISRVLPALGETGVELSSIDDLVHGVEVTGSDSPQVARLKGDPVMAKVISKAVNTRQRMPKEDLVVGYGIYELRVTASSLADCVLAARRGNRLHNQGRKQLQSLIIDRLLAAYEAALGRSGRQAGDGTGVSGRADFSAAMRHEPELKRLLDRMWPLLTPEVLLRDLFGAPALIKAASAKLLDEGDQKLLFRPRGESIDNVPWTSADIALLDEAATHIGPLPSSAHVVHDHQPRSITDGTSTDDLRTYGHIVVDEGQDLSPMQLRMLARRSLSGSMTIVGDIGQATGMWAPETWDGVLRHLPGRRTPRIEELTVGYRTPSEIMAVAARVLRAAAPSLSVPKSVRSVGRGPRLISGSPADSVLSLTVRALADLRRDIAVGTIGVICPERLVGAVSEALRGAEVGFDRGEGGSDVSVISVRTAKGLEFDGVVVVEPARIVAETPNGLRALFVALTRPTQALVMVHVEPLPECLGDPSSFEPASGAQW
jgi:DNA helicase IV